MTLIEWNDGLSLGVEDLDKQHKHLIGLANKLIHATSHSAYNEIKSTFHEFREYTIYHFADEENYMDRIRYPKLNEQKQQHTLLKNKVKYFQDTMYRHGVISQEEILDFLRNWLIGHIIKHDLQIKKFLETQPHS